MRLILEGETRARMEMGGEGFEIGSEGPAISPYHLLAASLASCTALTLQSWAEGAAIDMAPLTLHVAWEHAEERPQRIERIDLELRWPGLPEARVATAERVADLCPIHATLKRGTEIARRVVALPRAS
jgi:putative redox protein